MGNDFYTASSPLTVVGLNSVLNVTVLVRCIQPGKCRSRVLLHDYEIVTNLRSKLYNQNCCLGFCVEILWRAQRPGAAVRDLSVLLSDIPPASLASRCLSVVALIIINLFYFGSYGSILWMSRKSHTNMALIKYKYKFSHHKEHCSVWAGCRLQQITAQMRRNKGDILIQFFVFLPSCPGYSCKSIAFHNHGKGPK